MALCVPSDVYDHGVPRGSFPRSGRLVASVDTAANTLELDGHGFALDDLVSFRAEVDGSLPSPLVEGVEFFAIPVTEYSFSVAATAGGDAINLTTEGASIVAIPPSPLEAACDWATGVIEDALPAHLLPLVAPYPPVLVATAAELAAGKVLALTGTASVSIGALLDAALARVARWARGVPVRGVDTTAAGNLASGAAARSAVASDRRGWRTYGGIA